MYTYNAPINVLPHLPQDGQTLGLGGDLPKCTDIAPPLGQILKVNPQRRWIKKTRGEPSARSSRPAVQGLHRAHAQYKKVKSRHYGRVFTANPHLIPVVRPSWGRWGNTLIGA